MGVRQDAGEAGGTDVDDAEDGFGVLGRVQRAGHSLDGVGIRHDEDKAGGADAGVGDEGLEIYEEVKALRLAHTAWAFGFPGSRRPEEEEEREE